MLLPLQGEYTNWLVHRALPYAMCKSCPFRALSREKNEDAEFLKRKRMYLIYLIFVAHALSAAAF